MRPLIAIDRKDEHLYEATLREVQAAGWNVHPNLELGAGKWDVSEDRIVVSGEMVKEVCAANALLSVARGAGVVTILDVEGDVRSAFLHDLRRIGPIEVRTSDEPSPLLHLEVEQVRALEYLATGSTVAQVASRMNRSRRTTDRLLLDARGKLGASSNSEAATKLRTLLDRWRTI